MKLINTDGLALIGPGSEWFWTALSGIVLAVTFFAIYRQLSIQRSAAAIEQHARLLQEWNAEPMLRHRQAVLVAIRDGADISDLAGKVGHIAHIGNFWNGVGFLVKSGHVDRRLVYKSLNGVVQTWWTSLSPTILRFRADPNESDTREDFEWLSTIMANIDRSAGKRRDFSEAYLRQGLPEAIDGNVEALRATEALRSVILAPVPLPAATADLIAPARASAVGSPNVSDIPAEA